MSFALLFPGQGSQRPGMLASLEDYCAASATFDAAARELGYDPRAFDDERSLRSTVHVQIGLFLCGVICAETLASERARPSIAAGHSIGAFAAAVATRAISFGDALRAVRVRALAMERLFPSGYGMAVCSGLAASQVRAIVDDVHASGATVYVANINAAVQTVVAGSDAGLHDVLERCAQRGARRAERLRVSVPSHCELLQPVANAVRGTLDRSMCEVPSGTLLSGMTGRVMRHAAEVHADLCDGVAREVRWIDVARMISELGATTTIESVPGRVLTDLFEPEFPARREAMDATPLRSIVTLARRSHS